MITQKWLENTIVRPNTFKDMFLTSYSDENHEKALKAQKLTVSTSLFRSFIDKLNSKVFLYVAPFIMKLYSDSTVINEYWSYILKYDFRIPENASIVYDDKITNCHQFIKEHLFKAQWSENNFLEIAKFIGECSRQGLNVDTTKVYLFEQLYKKGLTPVDFVYVHLEDYISTWLSFTSYTLNASTYNLFWTFFSEFSIRFKDSSDWDNLIKTLVKYKLKHNTMPLDETRKIALIQFLLKIYKSVFRSIYQNEDNTPFYDTTISFESFFLLVCDLIQTIVTSDNLSDTIDTYPYEAKFLEFFNQLKPMYVWLFKKFDKTKKHEYINDVHNNSNDDNHIHFGLYTIWKILLETTDLKYEDSLGIVFNSLKAIHSISNFHTTIPNDGSDSFNLEPTDKYKQLLSNLKQTLQTYMHDTLDYDVQNLQKEDPFTITYDSIYKLVESTLLSSSDILIQPLLAELKQKYGDDLITLDELKEVLLSGVITILLEYLPLSVNNIKNIFLNKRLSLNLDDAVDKLQSQTPYELTRNIQNLVYDVLQNSFNEFMNISNFMSKIKEKITHILLDYSGVTKLQFDVLSNNLNYLKDENFQTYYSWFESAFKNKLRFILQKYKQQIIHQAVSDVYLYIFKLDMNGYISYIDIDTSIFKQLEYIMVGLLFSDVLMFSSCKLTNFPVKLIAPYKYFHERLFNDEDIKNLLRNSFIS